MSFDKKDLIKLQRLLFFCLRNYPTGKGQREAEDLLDIVHAEIVKTSQLEPLNGN